MNTSQKITLLIGLALGALMGVVPPWIYTWSFMHDVHIAPLYYYPVFLRPPLPTPQEFGLTEYEPAAIFANARVEVDWSRLLLQWLVLLLVVVAVEVYFSSQPAKQTFGVGPSFDLDEDEEDTAHPTAGEVIAAAGKVKKRRRGIPLPPPPSSEAAPQMLSEDDL